MVEPSDPDEAAGHHALRQWAARHAHPPHWAAWWQLVKSALAAWSSDYAPSMGAALAYYTVFSLAPLLVIVISVAGMVFGADAARGEIFGQLRGMMGADAAKGIEDLLANFSKPGQGLVGTLVGVAVLAVGATTVFGELQDALDRIWRAPVRAGGSGLWKLVRTRLLSFGMILGIAFLLMVSLVLSAVVSALGKWWGSYFEGWDVLARVVDLGVGFTFTTIGFAMIYKLMPRVRVGWRDVWVGSLVTALLFTLGRFLIGLYIGRTGVASGFGAAGSIVVVFVWVYYSAQIFLVGAEFTWVYAQTFGSRRAVPPGGAPTPATTTAQADPPGAPADATLAALPGPPSRDPNVRDHPNVRDPNAREPNARDGAATLSGRATRTATGATGSVVAMLVAGCTAAWLLRRLGRA